jgi:pyrimidine-nucleoside phosphorylase
MRIVDIIAKKRDGGALNREEIQGFIDAYAAGEMPDYQAAAWCMAVFQRGMSPEETGYLTRAMIASGEVIDLSGVDGPFVDKHSTGGVGDKVSLILAPLAAACGAKVPMMSGRALGHTGGTLDKLDSIPGYSTALDPAAFRDAVREVGFAMTGQSERVVPADRKMYALRDVTATVESIPLITASILSKKFAEGAESLVMDVKCGSGAFMKTLERARELARSLAETGKSLGRRVIAVITDMAEPLGRTVGNFLEVRESVECLRGEGPADLMEVTRRLTAWMLVAGGLAPDVEAATDRLDAALADGSAYRKFLENVECQGGDVARLERMLDGAAARYSRDVTAESAGFVTGIDAFAVGMAGVELGVGRNQSTDPVEALAGIEILKKRGEAVAAGEGLLRLRGEDEGRMDRALDRLADAVTVGPVAPEVRESLIVEEMA